MPCPARGQVDVVQPDAEAPDHDEAWCRREQCGVHLGAVAYDEGARAHQRSEQIRLPIDQRGVVEHVALRAKRFDRRFVHEFGDDDVRSGHGRFLVSVVPGHWRTDGRSLSVACPTS